MLPLHWQSSIGSISLNLWQPASGKSELPQKSISPTLSSPPIEGYLDSQRAVWGPSRVSCAVPAPSRRGTKSQKCRHKLTSKLISPRGCHIAPAMFIYNKRLIISTQMLGIFKLLSSEDERLWPSWFVCSKVMRFLIKVLSTFTFFASLPRCGPSHISNLFIHKYLSAQSLSSFLKEMSAPTKIDFTNTVTNPTSGDLLQTTNRLRTR